MVTADAFLAGIEAYLERTGTTATAFGRQTVRDPNFVFDLRKGRMPNLGLVDQVNGFMIAHPRGADPETADPQHGEAA